MPSSPSGSRADVFADRVQRYRRKNSPSQRQYASAPSFGQRIVKPLNGGQGKAFQNAPVGQAAPAVPATPYQPPAAPQQQVAASPYATPPVGGGQWPTEAQQQEFYPDAQPGNMSFVAPAGYSGPGSFNVSAPVADPNNPGFATSGANLALAQANYAPPGPAVPGIAPDGRPWAMVQQDAADAARYYSVDRSADGYMSDSGWKSFAQPAVQAPPQPQFAQLGYPSQAAFIAALKAAYGG